MLKFRFYFAQRLWHCTAAGYSITGTGRTVEDARQTFLAAICGVHPKKE